MYSPCHTAWAKPLSTLHDIKHHLPTTWVLQLLLPGEGKSSPTKMKNWSSEDGRFWCWYGGLTFQIVCYSVTILYTMYANYRITIEPTLYHMVSV